MAFSHGRHRLQFLADEVPPFAVFPWRRSVGLKGISASLPVACLEFPGISRKESIRGLGFFLASTRRVPGSSCSVPLQAHALPGPAVHPAEGTLSSRRSVARHRPGKCRIRGHLRRHLRHSSSCKAKALVILRLCPGARTDRRTSPDSKTSVQPRPGHAPAGRDPGALKGVTPRPPTPTKPGQRRRSPLAGPAPPASPIGHWPPRPRLSLGSDWLFAISRGPRPFSRLWLARVRAPTAL